MNKKILIPVVIGAGIGIIYLATKKTAANALTAPVIADPYFQTKINQATENLNPDWGWLTDEYIFSVDNQVRIWGNATSDDTEWQKRMQDPRILKWICERVFVEAKKYGSPKLSFESYDYSLMMEKIKPYMERKNIDLSGYDTFKALPNKDWKYFLSGGHYKNGKFHFSIDEVLRSVKSWLSFG